MPKIAVVTHESDNFHGWQYLLKPLLRIWADHGIESFVVSRPEDYRPADAAFVHVDLTVVPPETIALVQRYPVAINGRATDTRKRAYSTLLIDQQSNFSGAVIVKTDLNCGGWREFRNHISASLIGQLTRRLRGFETYYRYRTNQEIARPWSRRRILRSSEYPIFAHLREVPRGVWANPALVVERLVCERDGEDYCVRNYEFLGKSEGCFRLRSKTPIVKYGGSLERLNEPAPENLKALRERLGLDFGKIDYGVVDGEAVIYDVNRTTGNADDEAPLQELFDTIKDGIWDFVPRPRTE
jgi:hypothetical protein